MDNIIILDGIQLVVFLVILFVICFISIICSIGWICEANEKNKVENRIKKIIENKLILSEKNDYYDYMKAYEKEYLSKKLKGEKS